MWNTGDGTDHKSVLSQTDLHHISPYYGILGSVTSLKINNARWQLVPLYFGAFVRLSKADGPGESAFRKDESPFSVQVMLPFVSTRTSLDESNKTSKALETLVLFLNVECPGRNVAGVERHHLSGAFLMHVSKGNEGGLQADAMSCLKR